MSGENENSELLGFFAEDRHFIKELASAVRDLIGRPATTPGQIHHLAKLLFALNRLPRPTSGLCLELSLGDSHENGESNHLHLTLDDTTFQLDKTLYIIVDPAVGGDSSSEIYFAVEGRAREITHMTALMDWVEEFRSRVADSESELEISDAADRSAFNWEAESSDADWDKAESDYV
jgi:hypothetical protein